MNIPRLVLGFVIICVALWVIVGEQISGASADAVVNAQLSTLRTGIAGTVSLDQRALGSRVEKGEDLGTVVNSLVDLVRLDDMMHDRDNAKAEAARLASLISSIEATIVTLESRVEATEAERIADLQVRLDNARVRFALLKGNAEDDASAVSMAQNTPQGDPRIPAIGLNYAAEQVSLLDLALRAAKFAGRDGIGNTDASATDLRLIDLRTRLAELRAEAALTTLRQDNLATWIKTEQVRTNRLGALTLVSTVNGMLWEYLAADGETLQSGQEVARFVDCDSIIVTASVAENVYRKLSAGQSTTFRMSGDDVAYPGTVTRLAGAGAASIYRNLAVAPSQRHLERFDVTLLVPALRDLAEKRCAIGQTGRVFFDTRPLDWLRGLWR